MPDPQPPTIDVKSNLGAFAQYGKIASGSELEALDALGVFMGALGDIGCVFHGFLPPSPWECCQAIHRNVATQSTGILPPSERSDAGSYE
jgi:hypothetical protein